METNRPTALLASLADLGFDTLASDLHNGATLQEALSDLHTCETVHDDSPDRAVYSEAREIVRYFFQIGGI